MMKSNNVKKVWTFPGGGISKRELVEIAARREVKEEVGLDLFSLVKIGEILTTKEYKRDRVHCFYALVNNNMAIIDNNEVKTYEWFGINNLPDNISSISKEMISIYKFYS